MALRLERDRSAADHLGLTGGEQPLRAGVAFVELRLEWKAMDAIRNLDQKKFGGRKLTVNAAMPNGSNRKSDEQLSRIK